MNKSNIFKQIHKQELSAKPTNKTIGYVPYLQVENLWQWEKVHLPILLWCCWKVFRFLDLRLFESVHDPFVQSVRHSRRNKRHSRLRNLANLLDEMSIWLSTGADHSITSIGLSFRFQFWFLVDDCVGVVNVFSFLFLPPRYWFWLKQNLKQMKRKKSVSYIYVTATWPPVHQAVNGILTFVRSDIYNCTVSSQLGFRQ